jgi:hypothetical protein
MILFTNYSFAEMKKCRHAGRTYAHTEPQEKANYLAYLSFVITSLSAIKLLSTEIEACVQMNINNFTTGC